MRLAEVGLEKRIKEQALSKLTTREREIRKRIEDILEPHTRTAAQKETAAMNGPLKASNAKQANGRTAKGRGEQKKGKKRKNPA